MREHSTASAAALPLLAGVLLVQWLPHLPAAGWLLALLPVAAWAWRRGGRVRWLGWCLLGFAWAAWNGAQAFSARLAPALEGADLVLVGTLADLPQPQSDATRFTLRVDDATLDGAAVALRGLVTLAWYDDAPELAACSRWRLRARLKRPRALLNPGSQDSERSALERGIVAAGYVRADPENARLDAGRWCVDGVRARIAAAIDARVGNRHDAALLRAFAVGDTRALSQQNWRTARANGVTHLIAISGFHVGVAALLGVLLARLAWWLWPAFGLRVARTQGEAVGACLAALVYSALAGFGLPTVRTLLMIGVVALARVSRRRGGGLASLALALVAILAFDPLAVLAAGFWLSFAGVLLLMTALESRGRGLRGFLHELTAGQWLMTLGLLPLTLWFFGQTSLVGALSNLVAVPVVSFIVVPGALLGMLALALCPPLALPAWWATSQVIHAQWWLLERMARWPGADVHLPQAGAPAVALALLGVAWLFLPRGVPLRWLGLVLFLPLLRPPLATPEPAAFRAWVLDVGQGLAVLVQTGRHALLYDAGPHYRSGFDVGEVVVVPAIHALGIARLDRFVVSHGDNDHAGGAGAVAAAFPAAARLAGEPSRLRLPADTCQAGERWTWDGVAFEVLSPPPGGADGDNDSSCVLLVSGRGGRLLLTGDIGRRVEPAVAARVPTGAPLVLLVPHHGSKTSSGAAFIAALAPELAVVSTGWRNRFGHPRPEVVARYRQAGVPLLDTARLGAIELDFPATGPPRARPGWRARRARYWRE